MMKFRMAWLACLTATSIVPLSAQAQTERALKRRLDRNERQLQRQVNRADYYNDQAWQQINPWIQQYGINPIDRAANATRAAVGAAANTAERAAQAAGNVAEGAARVADATARGAARAATGIDGRVDGDFGYIDRNNQGWFYDYYTYTPTYYYGTDGAERYSGAIRYFDSDGDGVYDSHAYYRDSDEDGIYDQYDRIDFYGQQEVEVQPDTTTTTERTTTRTYVGPADARRHQVQGEIGMVKTAKVNGSENLVVALKSDSEQALAIDLGPAKAIQSKIEVGQRITATGAVERIGEKQLLVADSVKLGSGESIRIDRRQGTTITGNIVDVKETTIGSSMHYMAVVDVEGERQLVDLGPVKSYKVKLQPSTEVMVQGLPVRTRDHRVLMANRVRLGSEVVEINRSQSFSF